MARVKEWPVVEIFGPTVQGEGVDQGVMAHFIRFGGCDFRCDWCDTPHAVLPKEVRKNADKLDAESIGLMLDGLHDFRPPWVVITGGNPALHDLEELVHQLHLLGYKVAVETQGSRWREWFADVDRLCVSPKPPSSKQDYNFDKVATFMRTALSVDAVSHPFVPNWLFLKVVVFNEEDLDWACNVRVRYPKTKFYLSAGNDAGRTVGNPGRVDTRDTVAVRDDLISKSLWLTERMFEREELRHNVVVQSQYHVLLWGNELGR